jgi:branched-chain amino acid transport system permease protein
MGDMDVFERALVPSLTLGCTYALVAMGFVLLFRALGVLSFAQGAFMILGALFFNIFTADVGMGLVLALVLSMVATAIAGAATYVVVYRRARSPDRLLIALSTIGLGLALETVIYLIWGTEVRHDPRLLSGLTTITSGIVVNADQWFTIALTAILFILVIGFLRFTSTGIRMRATADNESLASYDGIRVARVATVVWALAALCAAAGGISFSLATDVDPVNLPAIGIAVFPAIIVGGVDSLAGCLVGGILVAFVSTVVGIQFGGQYQDMVAYLILLLMLIVRPNGLFGTPDVARI